MQFLLHADLLSRAVKDLPFFQNLLKTLQSQNIRVWASALHTYRLCPQEGNVSSSGQVDLLLRDVSILNHTAQELRDAMKESDVETALSVSAVRAFNLDGLIALEGKSFSAQGITVFTPEDILAGCFDSRESAPAVPLLHLQASYPDTLEEVEKEIAEVVRSGRFILGDKVEGLEDKVAKYCGVPYSVGVSSGTDALLIALMAAGIKAGDEVITTPFTFFATVGTISRLGARPVFVDIEPESFNIDPKKIAEVLTEKTRAIMPVHLYGQCADMDPILEIAQKNNLFVMEDAAQAIGSMYKGHQAGSLGDYGCFSFFPTKNLGGFGDGGLVTVKEEALAEKLKILRMHGAAPKYYHRCVGGNFRIDALQAGIVSARMNHLNGWLEKRRANAALYNRLFQSADLQDVFIPPKEIVEGHSYNQYVVRVPGKRDALRTYLGERKIASEIYYPVPLHLQKCFLDLGYKEGDFPHSEQAAKEVLALPISQEISPHQQEFVVESIRSFFRR